VAIMFKKKNQYDIIEKLGADALAQLMKDAGITVSTSMKGFILELNDCSVVVPKMVPLAQLKTGVSVVIKQKQVDAFSSGVKFLLDKVKAEKEYKNDGAISEPSIKALNQSGKIASEAANTLGEVIKATAKASKEKAESKLKNGPPKLKKTKQKEDTDKAKSVILGTATIHMEPVPSVNTTMAGETVTLHDASELGQPVSSTSTGSVYYTVAIMDDLKVAVRLLNGRVSVRAEGNISKYQANLLEAGFNLQNDYASFHVEAETASLRGKVVGSALFGLGVTFSKVISDVQMFDNKGV